MGMSHEAGPAPAIYPFSRRELTRRPPRSITGSYNDPADPGSSICPTCAAAFVAAVETLNERSAELLGGHVIEGGESSVRWERRKHIHLLPQFKQVASNPPQTATRAHPAAVMLDSSNVGDGSSKRRALAHADQLTRDAADSCPL